jgi:hypothetical protein
VYEPLLKPWEANLLRSRLRWDVLADGFSYVGVIQAFGRKFLGVAEGTLGWCSESLRRHYLGMRVFTYPPLLMQLHTIWRSRRGPGPRGTPSVAVLSLTDLRAMLHLPMDHCRPDA